MTRPAYLTNDRVALAYFDGDCGHLALIDEGYYITLLSTTSARPGHNIRVDDAGTACQHPQLCEGGSNRGNTLTWHHDPAQMGASFARDCRARMYKTRAGYERALSNANF